MQSSQDSIDHTIAGQTVGSRFLDSVAAHPDQIALRARDGDQWVEVTYAQLADRVAVAAAGLRSLGVSPGDRIVLMMRNIPEFHVIDLAALFCGATPISIYNSSSPEQIAFLAGHCKATLAIVEDMGFLSRFARVRHTLTDLKSMVILHDPRGDAGDDALAASTLFDHKPIDLNAALAEQAPDDIATVIYTSGTTGPSKGVVLTHRNIVWTAQCLLEAFRIDPVGFRAISYLPMAHIAERMAGHYMALMTGFEVSTCPDPDQVGTYLRDVHPQSMFGVPRVWEKIHAGVQAALAADPDARTKFDEAVAAAEPIAERRALGTATSEDDEAWAFLDDVAFRPVRELVGLDALRFAITGAAPIPADLIRWYRAIGVPLSEIYGMSESTGVITWEPTRVKPGTVGVALPGVDLFLADDGEVCFRGGNTFGGYLDDPDRTADAMLPDGAVCTGDLGEIDDEGYLRIIDRKKELIITAGGKNVSPANLETSLRSLPPVGQTCALGDGRPFVSALIVLDPDVAPGWFAERGIKADSVAELASDPEAHAVLQRAVDEVMDIFSRAERVKRVTVLADEWLPDSAELTPTSKLKRRAILAKYASQIDAMYA